ncbi:hypothetical protein NCS57_01156500 [Fusarium keratoplasticum]|uniref:Uncharacterized protein n=1 Tax=Fusarium keratoplasticum TaxID=1328300 RepID=A0ACC0QLT7_9HYPO|nr:hypothetical protein NCS57_01156500 [Fusarium keratoplasticum]KAI8657773.1 hypothetical protein NCS57_01156500 [Fusarium keratoplasticum]KAI8658734.1 hypothetical protein NCS55_01151000 [Fusarium keratoplasticum]
MDESERPRGNYQLRQLLLCFQCHRVPFDLIRRACEPKSAWSAAGEIKQIQPHEGGVPRWLLDFREAHRLLFDCDDRSTAPCPDGVQLVKDCGIWYFETRPNDSLGPDENEQNQDTYALQCIRIFNHAFPCRNTDVLGEEVAASLIPLAKAFLLPLLASVSEKDIQNWLLPKERGIQFAINLFDCLLQIITFSGLNSPFYPVSFPRKMVNAIDIPNTQYCGDQGRGVDRCLDIFSEMIEAISSSSPEDFERLALNTGCGDLDERSNAWTGLALELLLSSQTAERPRPQPLSDAIAKAAASWSPKSTTHPSPMEYLIAIGLLPRAQLRTISLPRSLGMELSILRGLLLSRMQYHDEAATVLHANFPAAITHWGLASFQVGIVAAESANCYNILRKEDVANTIAARCLAARNTPEFSSRPDWFYLSLYLVDSLIGSGRYAEAKSALEHLISQPPIAPAIHMMGYLRLSKIRRRVPEEDGIREPHHSLHEGLGLFRQVHSALREEYLEEVACSLEAAATTTTKGSLEAQKSLIRGVNDLLSQTSLRKSPAQKRFTQAQLEFGQRTLRQENNIIAPGYATHWSMPITRVRGDAVGHSNPASSPIIDSIPPPIATRRVFSVPYERDERFVMVPAVDELYRTPQLEDKIVVHSLHGEVGVGKTSLSTEFAYRVKDSYYAIIWIRDAPLNEIFDYLSRVAAKLELNDAESSMPIHPDQAREQMFRWFAHPRKDNFGGSWLIVFDGIEDAGVIRQLWPTGGQFGTVLVVTRRKPLFLDDLTVGAPRYIKLGPLNSTDAITLTRRYLNFSIEALLEPGGSISRDWFKHQRLLSEFLQGHPAAIKQATSLISRHNMEVWDFIAAYKIEQIFGSNSMAKDEILQQPNHNIHLITIWRLNPGDGEPLLNVISLLSPFGITENFLWPNESFPKLDGYPQSMSEFEEMRNQLLESSLIWKASAQQSLYTSPAVQTIFRQRMDQPAFLRAYCRALLLLADAWPCEFKDSLFIGSSTPTLTRCAGLWRHVSKLCDELDQFSSSLNSLLEVAQIRGILLDISWCAIKRHKYHQADSFLNFVSRILDIHGPNSPLPFPRDISRELCLVNHHKGMLAYRKGMNGRACSYFESCLRLSVSDLEPGSDDYWLIQAVAHHGVGGVKRRADDIPASIVSYEMSIKALEHIKGKHGQDLSFVRVKLGLALLMNEQPEDAERVLEGARSPKSMTNPADGILDSLRNVFLFFGLAIAKLVQNKAEESLLLALEYLDKVQSSSSLKDKLVDGFHLVISGSYGRISEFSRAQ